MERNNLSEKFENLFGQKPAVVSIAPGRINIIGEHTDYNGGYVLPAAIDRRIYLLAARREDDRVVMWAENFGEKEEFSVNDLAKSSEKKWLDYPKGIFFVLAREGHSLGGINALVFGDIPLGSGLSSSAALEVSMANALNVLFQLSLPAEKIPVLAQRAENEYVGVECGLMDQFVSVFGQKNEAVFLDCRTFEYDYVPLSLMRHGLKIVVVDSRVRRELASSEYNKRRAECRAAVEKLKNEGIESLRDISFRKLEDNRAKLGDLLYKRTRHVVTENERVVESVKALKADDFIRLGELLFESHRSLRDDYEVSCPELDLLYSLGKKAEGCLGARLTGAGFGGSGIALIREKDESGFKKELSAAFLARGFKAPRILEISIGQGASVQ